MALTTGRHFGQGLRNPLQWIITRCLFKPNNFEVPPQPSVFEITLSLKKNPPLVISPFPERNK